MVSKCSDGNVLSDDDEAEQAQRCDGGGTTAQNTKTSRPLASGVVVECRLSRNREGWCRSEWSL